MLDAPPEAVWSLLLDVDRFSACIPGVEDVRPIDDRTFDGTILASVGPMSGTFGFRARILEAEPLRALAAHVDGTDSVTRSTVAADMRMTLSPVADAPSERTQRTEGTNPSKRSERAEHIRPTEPTEPTEPTQAAEPAERTELAYHLTVDVHGRLAIVGDMILRATASVMLQEFVTRLRRQLVVAAPG